MKALRIISTILYVLTIIVFGIYFFTKQAVLMYTGGIILVIASVLLLVSTGRH